MEHGAEHVGRINPICGEGGRKEGGQGGTRYLSLLNYALIWQFLWQQVNLEVLVQGS